ncbi:hypothetical protein CC79DRAFT_1126039 [Sarocladium strictum]
MLLPEKPTVLLYLPCTSSLFIAYASCSLLFLTLINSASHWCSHVGYQVYSFDFNRKTLNHPIS